MTFAVDRINAGVSNQFIFCPRRFGILTTPEDLGFRCDGEGINDCLAVLHPATMHRTGVDAKHEDTLWAGASCLTGMIGMPKGNRSIGVLPA